MIEFLISASKTILSVWQIPVICIAAMTLITFFLYLIDKYKAKKGYWRIPEKTLLLSTLLFGGIGGFLGMRLIRHKTKHLHFQILVPLFLILQIVLYAAVIYFGLICKG